MRIQARTIARVRSNYERKAKDSSTCFVELSRPREGVRVVNHVGQRGALAEGKLFVVPILKQLQPMIACDSVRGAVGD